MAINQITISFTECDPPPAEGYVIFYRPVGSLDPYREAGPFFSSPAVFQDDLDGVDQDYEGYLQADCGGGQTSGNKPFDTTQSESSVGGGEFLRLVFNEDKSGMSLSDWNTLFNTATWASTPFNDVIYSSGGTVVDLYGMTDLQIATATFNNDLTIVQVFDFANCVNILQGACFGGAENLTDVSFPVVTDIANGFFGCSSLVSVNIPLITIFEAQAFAGCVSLQQSGITSDDITQIDDDAFNNTGLTVADFPFCTTCGLGVFRFCLNLTTVNLPICTACGPEFFRGNTSMTDINMPSCTDFGGTTGDDDMFLETSGMTFDLTIPTSKASDGDVVTAQANNTVNLILV